MKPDGVTMETTEPTDAVVGAELPSTQVAAVPAEERGPAASPTDEVQETAASPPAGQEGNDTLALAEVKVRPNDSLKSKPTTTTTTSAAIGGGAKTKTKVPATTNKRPATAPSRGVNGTQASYTAAAGRLKKTTTTTTATTTTATKGAPSTTGAVPKRPTGVAPSSVRTQTKVADKKPAGNARVPSAAAKVANGSELPPTVAKRAPAGPVNGARPRTTGPASRPATSTVPKPSSSAGAKPAGTAVSKATSSVRPPTGPATSRPASATAPTKTTISTRPSKLTTSRTVAPSTVRATAPQPPKTSAVLQKDVSNRPASAAAPRAKKPTPWTSSNPKKTEPSKALKADPPSKGPATTKAADPKPPRPKTHEATLKPAVSLRLPANTRQPVGQAKRGLKPTHAVHAIGTTKTKVKPNADPAAALPDAPVTLATSAAAAVEAIVGEPTEGCKVPISTAAPPENLPTPPSTGDPPAPPAAALSLPSSPVSAATPLTSPSAGPVENAAAAEPEHAAAVRPPEVSVPDPSVEHEDPARSSCVSHAKLHVQTPCQTVAASNLNEEAQEEEDEEEREASLPVSVSEMSGTTQATEESRPGSAGPAGGAGAAWRAGGALFSELDSEDVSGSQQGASELSAPGVLEGTESTDDLGDGSLKGAGDMEGASVGSPDLEKVPDIPVNDPDEEDYDEEDRVYDMDVGSEQAEAPPRPRHDNDANGGGGGGGGDEVEEDDDDDVEMASEAVTESGLESYGNADEDDLAEDERLDNLNRALPLPPQLPSGPDGQWAQPVGLANPWAQPLQAHQPLDQAAQPLAPNSPTIDPWQADAETPTQSPAHSWLELGSAPFCPQIHEASQQSSDQDDPPRAEDQAETDRSGSAQMQTLPSAASAGPAMSLGSDISTPEELQDYNQAEKLQADQSPVAPDPWGPDRGKARGEAQGSPDGLKEKGEAGTAAFAELPPVSPASPQPSSCSSTEEEASDTEGEALLDLGIVNNSFDRQRLAQRCLSAVEEGEELPYGVAAFSPPAEFAPPSAYNATYECDSPTSSDSSAHSPGIFSLEERPEQAKEEGPCQGPPAPRPLAQPCSPEQNYLQCGQQEADEDAVYGSEVVRSSGTEARTRGDDGDEEPQPPYYSAICEKTENCFSGLSTLPQPHRRRRGHDPQQSTATRSDVIMPRGDLVVTPRLTCADLPPRNAGGLQARSPQLNRLAQHQKQLLELQQRRELHNQPAEEEERTEALHNKEEVKMRAEEEARTAAEEEEKEAARKKSEKMEERRKEEVERQRRDQLQLQLQQQQVELQQRQQIMQWQQELEGQQAQAAASLLLSPSSGLCTIYEALENSEEEGAEEEIEELRTDEEQKEGRQITENDVHLERVSSEDSDSSLSSQNPPSPPPPPQPDSPRTPSSHHHHHQAHPLDWGKKVDMVQQLINQSLLLTAEGCCCASSSSPLFLLPGGSGGTLSPLESSLWPRLLPPLTPPSSATVTSVSSYSPEAAGSAPQGDWTVVELETHH